MSKTLVAPTYEPATAYHPPRPAPFEFGADTLSIEELLSAPATRDIVEQHASWAIQMSQSEHFQPFRSTFALRDMAIFLPVDLSHTIDAVDAALKQLPASEWPNLEGFGNAD